jgi:hypothetical protein
MTSHDEPGPEPDHAAERLREFLESRFPAGQIPDEALPPGARKDAADEPATAEPEPAEEEDDRPE